MKWWRKLFGMLDASLSFQDWVEDMFRAHEAALREKLEEIKTVGPVGVWWHSDNEPVIDSAVWTFSPDGSGRFQHYGTFGHADIDPVIFAWQRVGESELKIHVFDSDGESGLANHVEPSWWMPIRFLCVVRKGERIASLVMEDCTSAGVGCGRFGRWLGSWINPTPVHWQQPLAPKASVKPVDPNNSVRYVGRAKK